MSVELWPPGLQRLTCSEKSGTQVPSLSSLPTCSTTTLARFSLPVLLLLSALLGECKSSEAYSLDDSEQSIDPGNLLVQRMP